MLPGLPGAVKGAEHLPSPRLRGAAAQGLDSKALFRSPCGYFSARNQVNVKAEGQHNKNLVGSVLRTHATAGEDIPHTSTCQAKLVISFTSLSYSEGKEENCSLPFSLVTYVLTNIYF